MDGNLFAIYGVRMYPGWIELETSIDCFRKEPCIRRGELFELAFMVFAINDMGRSDLLFLTSTQGADMGYAPGGNHIVYSAPHSNHH